MRTLVFLLIFNLLYLAGQSQSNIRLNNYWENTYYINPASIYSDYRYVASVAARNQWTGFPGAPDTEYITFTARLNTKKKVQIGQLGLKVFRDYIGYTKLINIAPSYSYSIQLIRDKLLMNLGAAGKILNLSYNSNLATTAEPDDPAVENLETKWTDFNTDVGVEFVSRYFVAGAVSQNLMSLYSTNSLQTNANFVYAMARLGSENFFQFLPGICFISNEGFYQTEYKISVLVDSGNKPFQIGFFYRTKEEMGILYGIDISKTIRLAGSYDYNVGSISHGSFGTPEIMLIWKIGKIPFYERIPKCNDCWEFYK